MKQCIFLLLVNIFFFSCASISEVDEVLSDDQILDDTPAIINQDAPYTQGEWNGSEFASEWFGFRYRPTDGMVITPESALREINASLSMSFDGPNAELYDYTKMQIAYEVMATSFDGESTVEVLSEKIFAEDLTEAQYAEILNMELSVTHGRGVVFSDSKTRKIGNTDFLDLSATITFEGKTTYQTVLLNRKGDRFATVLLEFRTPEKLDELLMGFSPY